MEDSDKRLVLALFVGREAMKKASEIEIEPFDFISSMVSFLVTSCASMSREGREAQALEQLKSMFNNVVDEAIDLMKEGGKDESRVVQFNN